MATDTAKLAVEISQQGVVQAAAGLDKLANNAGKAETATAKLNNQMRLLTAVASSLYAVIKTLDIAKDLTLAAARFETLGVVMEVAGRNAGYTAVQMMEFQKILQSTGISMTEARQSLTAMATAQIDLSKSAQTARAAQNLAVVAGISSSEAFSSMTEAIAKGNNRILTSMGLIVQWETEYAKMAGQRGKSIDQLTEEERVIARTNTVIQAAAAYNGIYEASMQTASKQLGSMKRYIDDIQVSLGTITLESFSSAIGYLSEQLKAFDTYLKDLTSSGVIAEWSSKVANAFKFLGSHVDIVAVAVAAYLILVKGLLVWTGMIAPIFTAAGASMLAFNATMATSTTLMGKMGAVWAIVQKAFMANPFGWIALAIAGLYVLYKNLNEGARAAEDLRKSYHEMGNAAGQAGEQIDALSRISAAGAVRGAQKAVEDAADAFEEQFKRMSGMKFDVPDPFKDIKFEEAMWAAAGMHISGVTEQLKLAREEASLMAPVMKQATTDAANAFSDMLARMQSESDKSKHEDILRNTLQTLEAMAKAHPNIPAITTMVEQVEALTGAYANTLKAAKKLDSAQQFLNSVMDDGSSKVKNTTADYLELAASLQRTTAAQLAARAAQEGWAAMAGKMGFKEILAIYTDIESSSQRSKQATYDLQQAQSKLAEAWILNAQTEVQAEISKLEAIIATGEALAVQFEQLAAQKQLFADLGVVLTNLRENTKGIKMPRDSEGESILSYREQQLHKINELTAQLSQTQAELYGINSAQVQILNIQIEREKALYDLQKAADKLHIGSQDSQLLQAKDLVNQIADMKIRWQETLAPIQAAKDLAEAMGDTMMVTALSGAEIAAKMKMIREDSVEKRGGLLTADELESLTKLSAAYDTVAWSTRFATDESNLFKKESVESQAAITAVQQALYSRHAVEKAGHSIYKDTVTAMQDVKAQALAYKKALDEGSISAEYNATKMVELQLAYLGLQQQLGNTTFAEDAMLAIGRLAEGWRGASVEITSAWTDFFKNFSSGFADSIGQAVVYGKDLESSLIDVAKTIQTQLISALIQVAVQLAIIKPLMDSLAGVFSIAGTSSSSGGSFFSDVGGASISSSVHHSGGIVGQAASSRIVDAAVFANAARYHSGGIAGMRPDERAAILQVGEEVLTRGDPRHRSNLSSSDSGTASQSNIQIIDQRGANAPEVEVQQAVNSNGGTDYRVVIKSELQRNAANGSLDGVMMSRYGVRPRVRGR